METKLRTLTLTKKQRVVFIMEVFPLRVSELILNYKNKLLSHLLFKNSIIILHIKFVIFKLKIQPENAPTGNFYKPFSSRVFSFLLNFDRREPWLPTVYKRATLQFFGLLFVLEFVCGAWLVIAVENFFFCNDFFVYIVFLINV